MSDEKLLWKLIKKIEKIPAEKWMDGLNATYHDDNKLCSVCSETLYDTDVDGMRITIAEHRTEGTRYSMDVLDKRTHITKSFDAEGDELKNVYDGIKKAHDIAKQREDEELRKKKVIQEREFEDRLWEFAEKD